jgi:transposase
MFPRVKSYKNKDGSWRHYLYLVAAKRIGGKVRQVTTANFGRVEDADKILPDVVEKLAKFSKKLKVINLAKDMKADWVKEYGAVIIFKRIWGNIGLNRYLHRYTENRKMGFDVVEIIYSMVLNRLIEPKSELGIHTWVKNVYGMKEVEDLHQWYRSLDFLIEHKDELESDLYEAQKDLFNQEIDVVLMDITSVVYFGDGEKAEEILDYGFSKEKRFDLKQVIVGIFMTKDGMPIGHEVYPGNTNDITAFKEMIKKVSGRFKIRRVIIVCDRGMVSEKNIKQLEIEGYEYVVGMRMRQLGKEDAGSFLSTRGMKSVTKDLRAKEVDFKGKRLVVCFNKEQARRDKHKREEIIVRLLERLKTQGLKSILVHKEYSKYLKIKAEKPELDEEKVKAEEIFDGKFVLQTNTELDWKEVVLAYKDLWQVEAAFRTLKSELEMGPIYHYTERRIRAHIFVCFLALLLKIVFHKNLLAVNRKLSLNKVLEDIKKIKAVQITIKDIPVVLRTELERDAHYAFKAAGVKIPPRLLSEPSDIQETVVLHV